MRDACSYLGQDISYPARELYSFLSPSKQVPRWHIKWTKISSFLILSTPRFTNHFIISTTQYKRATSSHNEQASYQNHLTERELLSKSYQMFLNMFTHFANITFIHRYSCSVTIAQAHLLLLVT